MERNEARGEPGHALLREMNAVGGALFLTGGLAVLVVLVGSTWPGRQTVPLAVATVVAIVAGLGLIGLSRVRPLPQGVLQVLAILGTLNISLAVVGGGPNGSAAFGVLYVFVTVFSFYYFPHRLAVFEVVLTAMAYAASLAVVGMPDALAQWLVVTSANVVIGALIGRAGQRVRESLEDERAAMVKLRELDDLRTAFLRAVSHELRTPLTSVVGYTETLRRQLDHLDRDTTLELIDRVGTNADRLQRLLANLLDIDRISRGVIRPQRELTNVGDLVRAAVDLVDAPSHLVHVEVVGLPMAWVEGSKVERIVENLVGNAIRHTPSGSSVLVGVCEDPTGGVVLTVDDDGPGIPAPLREAVFDAFVQGSDASSSATPGTGIGLSLVAKFTQLHDGTVEVGSSELGGARFVVRLPEGRDDRADAHPLRRYTPGDVEPSAPGDREHSSV